MEKMTIAQAQAEVERRRTAAAILRKARTLSKSQLFMLRENAVYRPKGFSTFGVMQETTAEILRGRFGYLDRHRVEQQDVGEGRFIPAYWIYTVNQAGKDALTALGIEFEITCPDCRDSINEACPSCGGAGRVPASAINIERRHIAETD